MTTARNAIGLMLCLALGAAISFGGIIAGAAYRSGHVHVEMVGR